MTNLVQRWTHLVLFHDFTKRDDLCVCEAGEGVDVVAALEQLALVSGEPALPADVDFGSRLLRKLPNPSLDVTAEVIYIEANASQLMIFEAKGRASSRFGRVERGTYLDVWKSRRLCWR